MNIFNEIEHGYTVELKTDRIIPQNPSYRITQNGVDVTARFENSFTEAIINAYFNEKHANSILENKNKRLTETIETYASKPAVMTSPIGDLTVDSAGMKRAIDEIAFLRSIIADIKTVCNMNLQ